MINNRHLSHAPRERERERERLERESYFCNICAICLYFVNLYISFAAVTVIINFVISLNNKLR